MSALLVGTASWTDKSLLHSGRFYPPGVQSAEERLRFYATRFPIVEVDSSYYALPSVRNAELWAERSPEGFVFNVKAFRLFTGHQTPPVALPPDIREVLGETGARNIYYKDVPEEVIRELWARFRESLAPLQRAGRLGAIHFQFSPWVTYGRKSLLHIETCAAMLPECRIAVEFRHRSWFADQHARATLDFERAHGLINAVVDEPAGFPNSIPAIWEATRKDLAVVRLHGRNHETWNLKGLTSSAQRFNYDYTEEELHALAGNMLDLSSSVDVMHVIFNNNFEDQGMRNAASLMEILRARRSGSR
jgi:uncharacterized protein YecE (DUF72 family)